MVVGYSGHADDLQERHHGRRQRERSCRIGPPGDTRAFDAVTGQEALGLPHGAAAGRSRSRDVARQRLGESIGHEYVGILGDDRRGARHRVSADRRSRPSNYYGGDRPGNNLFGNSVVAVDILTGKYKWHFQTVHHDIWDIDMSAAPGLVDIKQGGRTIPALATVGKGGYMFILDRDDRQAGVRRRGAAGAEGQRAGRVVFADAAVSGEAAGAREDQLQERRHGDRRGHERRNTSRTARRCGTRAAGSRTTARSRRSRSTKTARRRSRRFRFLAARAASTGAARPPIRAPATST